MVTNLASGKFYKWFNFNTAGHRYFTQAWVASLMSISTMKTSNQTQFLTVFSRITCTSYNNAQLLHGPIWHSRGIIMHITFQQTLLYLISALACSILLPKKNKINLKCCTVLSMNEWVTGSYTVILCSITTLHSCIHHLINWMHKALQNLYILAMRTF